MGLGGFGRTIALCNFIALQQFGVDRGSAELRHRFATETACSIQFNSGNCSTDNSAAERLRSTSFIIHYFGWQTRSKFGGHCPRWGRLDDLLKRIADIEMHPMTFLDPGAFVRTNPGLWPKLNAA